MKRNNNNSSMIIFGGRKVNGDVKIPGDKISAVHLLFASLISNKQSSITDVQFCGDVKTIIEWIQLHNIAELEILGEKMNIKPTGKIFDLLDISSSRASICLLSALALKYEQTKIKSCIGGCSFTDRGIDKHLELARSFGILIQTHDDEYFAKRMKIVKNVFFDCSTKFGPSVGVTAHAIIASMVFDGALILKNIALEPVIYSLIDFVQKSTGRNIVCQGRTLIISSARVIQELDVEVGLKFDMTVAMTFVAATMATNGSVKLVGVKKLLPSIYKVMDKIGIHYKETNEGLVIDSLKVTHPSLVICKPWPGIPSDIGPILSAGLCMHNGFTRLVDTVYDSRSSHVEGLNDMGYCLRADGQMIDIIGQKSTQDNFTVSASDIRAGAALLIAALARKAMTIIEEPQQIFRGYDNIVSDMNKLGMDIRIGEKDE